MAKFPPLAKAYHLKKIVLRFLVFSHFLLISVLVMLS